MEKRLIDTITNLFDRQQSYQYDDTGDGLDFANNDFFHIPESTVPLTGSSPSNVKHAHSTEKNSDIIDITQSKEGSCQSGERDKSKENESSKKSEENEMSNNKSKNKNENDNHRDSGSNPNDDTNNHKNKNKDSEEKSNKTEKDSVECKKKDKNRNKQEKSKDDGKGEDECKDVDKDGDNKQKRISHSIKQAQFGTELDVSSLRRVRVRGDGKCAVTSIYGSLKDVDKGKHLSSPDDLISESGELFHKVKNGKGDEIGIKFNQHFYEIIKTVSETEFYQFMVDYKEDSEYENECLDILFTLLRHKYKVNMLICGKDRHSGKFRLIKWQTYQIQACLGITYIPLLLEYNAVHFGFFSHNIVCIQCLLKVLFELYVECNEDDCENVICTECMPALKPSRRVSNFIKTSELDAISFLCYLHAGNTKGKLEEKGIEQPPSKKRRMGK